MLIIGHSNTDIEIIRKTLAKRGAKIYFIGIGGISMSSLAMMANGRGLNVAGSDIRITDITKRLATLGIRINYTHGKAAIMEYSPDIVVYSLSISGDNPEYLMAKSLGILCVSRAELLGAFMTEYVTPIGISGSHGKSTTTAMTAKILECAGLFPTVLCGAEISDGIGYIKGEDGGYLVYEACEYGDSFLKFSPKIQIMLNLDLDHTDYFKDEAAISESFLKAANLSETVILSADSKNLRSIIDRTKAKIITYGTRPGFTYRYEERELGSGKFGFALYKGDVPMGEFELSIIGRYNVQNAVGAAIAAEQIGISKEIIREALLEFSGIPRRMEFLKKTEFGDVYYDYAHHPCEIKAAREALEKAGYKRIYATFFPHTYSRTKSFFYEFAKELSLFDTVFITDIFGAREKAITGISSSALSEAVRECGGKSSTVNDDDLFIKLRENSGDCLVIMGAGDALKIKEKIFKL